MARWRVSSFNRNNTLDERRIVCVREKLLCKKALLGTSNYPDNYTDDVMNAYLTPFPSPESRKALLCWSRDITVKKGAPSYDEIKHIEDNLSLFKDLPVLIIWGMLDLVLPGPVLEKWRQLYPHAKVFEINDANHFLHEDAPKRMLAEIKNFI